MAPSETPPTAARRLFDHPSVRANYADMTAASSFVSQMANGTLPRAKYVAFLSQDRYFLFHFNRAYASALARAPGIEQQRTFHALIGGVLDELKLHEDACARWGVDDGALETIHPASRAYVDFLTALQSPDVPMDELVAGMTPCMRLYAALGRDYLERGLVAEGCAYREWFDAYGGDEMEALAASLEALLPEDIAPGGCVEANYARAMELERDFFAAHA